MTVSGGAISELAMHYLERHKIMVVKVPSKFNLRRRICISSALEKKGGSDPALSAFIRSGATGASG